jgi:hypothetical protein
MQTLSPRGARVRSNFRIGVLPIENNIFNNHEAWANMIGHCSTMFGAKVLHRKAEKMIQSHERAMIF